MKNKDSFYYSAFIYHKTIKVIRKSNLYGGDRKTFLTVGRIIKSFQNPTDAFTAILLVQNNKILYLIGN
jgi:hypothetical protein